MQPVGHFTGTEVSILAVTMNTNIIPEYWTFAQLSQAAILLDIVIEHIFDVALDEQARLLKAAAIDRQVREFLLAVMSQPKIKGLDVCLAYTLILRYVS